jgi:hypothetical protein
MGRCNSTDDTKDSSHTKCSQWNNDGAAEPNPKAERSKGYFVPKQQPAQEPARLAS